MSEGWNYVWAVSSSTSSIFSDVRQEWMRNILHLGAKNEGTPSLWRLLLHVESGLESTGGITFLFIPQFRVA